MKQTLLLKIILVSSCIGFLLSLYALTSHYSLTSSDFCTLSETINCEVVNKGSYSEFYGIPVALLGVIGYLFIFSAAWMKRKRQKDLSLSVFLLVASCMAFLFSLFLTGIETFVLQSWCLLCLGSQLVILVIFLSAIFEYRSIR